MLSRLTQLPAAILRRLPAAIPSSCALCGCGNADALCDACRDAHVSRRSRRCVRCAIPLSTSTAALCGECLKSPPAFDATVVVADYAPPLDGLVLALKFGKRLEMAKLFAQLLQPVALGAPMPARLTAVPLGTRRLVERGFNQALEIARPLARALDVPVEARLLIRQRETHAQALLHPDERRRNVRQAFTLSPAALDKVQGQHIGVVDDVMTTGETLNEVATTLKRFGAARVTNYVFARTPAI